MGYESREEILRKKMHDLVHHTLPNGIALSLGKCRWGTRW